MASESTRIILAVIAMVFGAANVDFGIETTPLGCVQQGRPSGCFTPVNVIGAAAFQQTPDGANATINLTFAWDSPEGPEPLSYILEAGSASGLADVAVYETGSPNTSLFVMGVPPGRYYVRVRARTLEGISDPSNEVTINTARVRRPSPVACPVPVPPTGVVFTTSGPTVTVSWLGSSGATSYQVEAGSRAGASNLFKGDVGNLTMIEANVAPGTYYVRVRARGDCGASVPSQEIAIRVP
jgi:hypothetical protein